MNIRMMIPKKRDSSGTPPLYIALVSSCLATDLPLSREQRFRYSSVSEVATLVGCSGMLGSIVFHASMTLIRTSFCASAYRLFA